MKTTEPGTKPWALTAGLQLTQEAAEPVHDTEERQSTKLTLQMKYRSEIDKMKGLVIATNSYKERRKKDERAIYW